MERKATDEECPAPGSAQSSSQPSRLCQACLSVLTRDGLEVWGSYDHHRSPKSLVDAARAMCCICSPLFSSLPPDEQRGLVQLAEGRIPDWCEHSGPENSNSPVHVRSAGDAEWPYYDNGTSWGSITKMKLKQPFISSKYLQVLVYISEFDEVSFPPHMTVNCSTLEDMWREISLHLYARHETPLIVDRQVFREIGHAKSLSSNTESLTTWAIAKEWVRECSEQHTCLAEVDTKWYPTRLVERLSSETFRVVRSDSGLFKPGRSYVTLSYRWGNDDFLKLTAENLSAFENGQPITALRKTFRDAMIVAEHLGTPYIWIDSLCIIQSGDKGADWRQESIAMADIYSNSFCNISADWGDESNGLFFERTPRFHPPCPLNMRWEADQNGISLPVGLKPPNPPPDGVPVYIVCRDGWYEDPAESPLNSRGWVLQERLLAPRVLHFSPNQISWECGHNMLWERVPLNLMDARPPAAGHKLWDVHWRDHLQGLRINVDWPTIVAHFTACQLTNESDRLVAIAGIAKKVGPVLNDQYVAGLWARSLPWGLLWRSLPGRKACPPQTQYFSPSFSWAAAGGRVLLPAVDDEFTFQEVSAAAFIRHRKKRFLPALTRMITADPVDEILKDEVFVPLSSPQVEVRLRGRLRSCFLVPQRLVPPGIPEICACPSPRVDYSVLRECFYHQNILTVKYDRVGEAEEETELKVFYFIIIERYDVDHISRRAAAGFSRRGYPRMEGLLLKSVDVSMGRFERVGLVSIFRRQKCPGILDPLGNERELPAWSYDETTGEHTFYIV